MTGAEAAHIRPVGDGHHGPDSVRNGLALSRTMHWLFDRGLVSAQDDFTILTAKKLIPDFVMRMLNPDGRLIVPDEPVLWPHPASLRYHRERIYKGD
jgi:putative restriction endonuclease